MCITDGSVMDIWLPLSMGGTIVIPTAEQLQDPEAMRGVIRTHSVVFLMIVPSHFQVQQLSCCHSDGILTGPFQGASPVHAS